MANLFLIEHDPDLADCLRRVFEAEGFQVICSETVQQALPKVADTPPAAAVVDLHDGGKVTQEDISALAGCAGNIPVLVTALYQTPEIACKALGIGARDYLLKPFGTREIVDRVRRLTDTPDPGQSKDPIQRASASIHLLSNIEDILRVCLDQLAGSLHLSDCLIALKTDESFKVRASRGYRPDPLGRTTVLSDRIHEFLTTDSHDSIWLSTDGVREILSALGLGGHRPFPTLMPIARPGTRCDDILGFVMGHGGIILEENDLLEMERFLAEVGGELEPIIESTASLPTEVVYDHEEQWTIPKTSYSETVNEILSIIRPCLAEDEDATWIRLAVEEAITNAVVHGHGEPCDRPKRTIRVSCAAGPSRLVLTVEDQGEGFDHHNVPDPTAEENLLNINGRGIFLMRTIMDEVVYNDRGNRVSLVKRLEGRPLRPFRSLEQAAQPKS